MFYNKREQLKAVFEDTVKRIQSDQFLRESTEKSVRLTKHFAVNDYPSFESSSPKKGAVAVTRHSTFEAAQKLHKKYPDKRIAVLNFASATNPGGGVTHGASAQEEALCRCSTLYPTLNQKPMWELFYNVNRNEKNVLHSDACIYSPDVIVFKSDASIPQMLPTHEWFAVDVISCAAPNLRNVVSNAYNVESGDAVTVTSDELYQIHLKRARHIMTVAAANQTDMLVLGAFGCGAFANDPHVVAKAMFDALKEFGGCFDLVEFAIYCRSYETENYDAFMSIYLKEGFQK